MSKKTCDINDAFNKLEKNTKGISGLLKDLNAVMENLSSAMREKTAARTSMTNIQIRAFSEFREFYADGTTELRHELSRLSAQKKRVMADIMAEDADFNRLYYRLLNITKRQIVTITNISGIISAARDTLELIA